MAKVFGMHAVELKPSVDEKEFEEFVRSDVLPIYGRVPGQCAYLLKGDRGQRLDQYLVLIEIDSPELRDQIYPPEGGVSEEVLKLVEGTDSVWDKLSSYVVEFPDPNYTDYVMVD